MRWLIDFGQFWFDFIVGDDWTIAVGVIVAVMLTAVGAHYSLAAWLVLPITVLGGLAWSVARVPLPPAPTDESEIDEKPSV
jgi:hypothetical protein